MSSTLEFGSKITENEGTEGERERDPHRSVVRPSVRHTNVLPTCKRTTAQIKTKLKNLEWKAKSRFKAAKRHSGLTGGGPPAEQLSFAVEKLVARYITRLDGRYTCIPRRRGIVRHCILRSYMEDVATVAEFMKISFK